MVRTCFIVVIFYLTVVSLFSQSVSAKITIHKSKIKVENLLKEISRQSGMDFSYNPRSFDIDKKISFHIENATLDETLKKICSKIPVKYIIVEGQIVLNRNDETGRLEIKEREYYSLSGFVSDRSSGESLIGANVFTLGKSIGTSTNEFGYYSMNLPKGKYKVQFSYLGFSPEIEVVELNKDKKKNIRLNDELQKLPAIIIEMPVIDLLDRKKPGEREISKRELSNMPEFGSSSGLIKGLQAQPGVSVHSDGSAFYFVRGGEKDQNLIIIDDAPIYNPAHLFGFYSLVIPDFTKSIKLYKSDIPVSLGDRLSSVLDIRTKDGNLNKFEINGATSLILNRLSVEGPIVKGKSSFFTSLRLSNFNWLYKKYVPDLNLGFGDFNLKWNYKINSNNRFYFTFINSSDIFSNTGVISGTSAGIQWNNLAMTLRWNHIFNPKLFLNTIFYTGNYQYKISAVKDIWHSGIGSLSLKSDFTWYNSSKMTSKFGLELHGYFFNPGKILEGSLVSLFPAIKQDNSRQTVIYFNSNYHLSEKLRLNAGLRMSTWSNYGPATYYDFDDKHQFVEAVQTGQGAYNTYFNPDPRVSATYYIDSTSLVKLSYGIYHQFIHLISNSTSPFTSFEVWLPSSPNIKPQKANQISLGFVKYIPKAGIELSMEAYYKKMSNQIDYEPHANTFLNPLIEGELRFGKMNSYGSEFLVKKDRGKFNGWIAYTYSRTMRRTPEINKGKEYPAFQDRPHDLSLMMNYNISRRLMVSLYWTSYSGSTFSSPTGFYTFKGNRIPIYGQKNNDRLPAYHRMDFAVKFILNKNPENRYRHSLTFSLFNALAHKNIVDINFNKIENENNSLLVKANVIGQESLIATQTMLVRFLPSLTYKFNFK